MPNEDGPVTKRAKRQVAVEEVKKELVQSQGIHLASHPLRRFRFAHSTYNYMNCRSCVMKEY